MRQQIKRRIGQILTDGRFMSKRELDHALDEQKHTKELLGQVLVRMGVVKERDFRVPLIVQQHLGHIDDAVKIAAGERELLGALLVHSGHITIEQLDFAIAEQKRSGNKLGEVFVHLGMLKEEQLTALLDFQKIQGEAIRGPLRLGELLVATGHISRQQLDDAIYKQALSHKKIGEVLVEEGYIRPSLVKYGICMQRMLVGSVLAGIMSLGMGTTGFASNVELQWDQSSGTDVAGYRVYGAPDVTPLESAVPIDVQNQTAATVTGLDPSKSYKFAVTAYSSSGAESVLSNVVSLAEQTPPEVFIQSPENLITVSGIVSVSVNATDNVGVSKIEFYVNGVLAATDTSTPYVYSWDTTKLASGIYTLVAKAYDAAGNVGQSATTSVTVVNDVIPPTVAVTVPINNAVVSGTLLISSSVSDNVGVSKVEFLVNGVLLYVTNVPPYSFYWNTVDTANGNYTIVATAYDNAGNSQQSVPVTVTVNNVVPDTTAPVVTGFTLPATSTALTVPVTGLTASDNVAVSGYMITESATAPAAGATGWSAAVPASFTFSSAGAKTAYAWAKDAAGNVSGSRPASVTITVPDVTAPVLNSFTLPATSTALTVPVTGLTASDNVAVSGYMITESATAPAAGATGWSATVPANFTFSSAGTKTAYAWAKDAAGNVSGSRSATVTITSSDVTAPSLTRFTLPTTATSLTVPVTRFSASDNIAVTGYLITESSAKPSAGASGWSTTRPTSFTFSSAGTKTAYAWAKDAAGNVSGSRSATVTITLPDAVAPAVALTNLVAGSTVSGVVAVTATASDNVGVSRVEFYVNNVLKATDTASPYTFSWDTSALANGTYTLLAKAYDAASNVAQSAAVTVTVNNPSLISAWSATTVPGIVDSGPDSAVELGVKFRSDIAGSITGIRFYKAGTNSGTHIGNLWDTTGKLLATATFSNESASGWQQVNFPAPVAIAANTVYVASYHTNVGHYSDDQYYFAGKGVDNGPLHLLADGISGSSGVYAYGSTSRFPSQGWNSSNYWVDVVLKK